jgi:hypothetical protein
MDEMRDGDRRPCVGARFHVVARRLIESELSMARQVVYGEGGERLRERRDLEPRLRRVRREMLEVRVSVSLSQQNLPFVRDEHRPAELPELRARGEIAVDLFRDRRCCAKSEREGEQEEADSSHPVIVRNLS